MKNVSYKKRISWQMAVISLEILGISFLIAKFTNLFVPCITFMDWLDRILVGSSIYSLILQLTVSQINDAEKDSRNTFLSICKLAVYACEQNKIEIYDKANRAIELQLSNVVLNHPDIIDNYNTLQHNLYKKDINAINQQMIMAEHDFNASDLQWKYSFILRLFK